MDIVLSPWKRGLRFYLDHIQGMDLCTLVGARLAGSIGFLMEFAPVELLVDVLGVAFHGKSMEGPKKAEFLIQNSML